jgi:hypothetical protein
VAGIGALIALLVIAWLGIECALLKHEITEAENQTLKCKLDFETFQKKSGDVLQEKIKQNAIDADQIQVLAKKSLEAYEKGQADAKRNFAALAKRDSGLRFAAADSGKASPDSGGVPKDAGTPAPVSSTCDDKLRDAREQFNVVVGAVEEVTRALEVAQDQANRLQQMIEFERMEREKINGQ